MAPTADDLFRRHALAVYRYFRRMTGRPDVAEDLTQDVFLRVVRSIDGYQARDREVGWVFRIAGTCSSALLGEFAVMRAHVEQDGCRPSSDFLQTTAEKLRHSRAKRLWRGRFMKLALAASLLVAVGSVGFRLGSDAERQRNRQAAHVVSRPLSTVTLRTPSQAPSATTAAANVVKPSARRPPQQTGGPPAASLRLRFGQWRGLSSAVDAEGQRH